MPTLHASWIVSDIRSGMADQEILEKYKLSDRRFKRLMRTLVEERVIDHDELYAKSVLYKELVDRVSSRGAERVVVPLAIRVYREDAPSGKGFLRDLSENGARVAGIKSNVGDAMTLRLPLKELAGIEPVLFRAVCRWTDTRGKAVKYLVGGYEITDIDEESRFRLTRLIEVFRFRGQGGSQKDLVKLDVPSLMESVREMTAETEAREFSGTLDGVDILEVLQFLLLGRKRTMLYVQSYTGAVGELYLDEGSIVHAVRGSREGREAFFECVGFPGGTFSTCPWREPANRSIVDSGDRLLLEAARMRDDLSAEP